MSKAFYSRLALTNIRKNRNIYLPYLLAGALITALYYILSSVAVMARESGMEGSGHVHEMLGVSAGVCGVLSLAVLFYINSFVMKRRGREFGLYSILGMGKRHISLVILWEVLLTALVSIVGGIAGGALLSQLLFLVLLRMVKAPVSLTFQIPLSSVAATALLFCGGFLIVLAADIVSVWRRNPADLLRSASQGEREPKSRRLLAVLGILLLGGGYGVAWSAKSPYDSMNLFLPAVLLVIAGTFLLFIAGSISLLKLMRRKKHFYYRPGNFIAVSGMLYRMKQNAAGLANICILSTCVLVTLSSTVCLFLGEEDLLLARFPRQIQASCIMEGEKDGALLREAMEKHAGEYGFAVENDVGYLELSYAARRQGDSFTGQSGYTMDGWKVRCITITDYNAMTGRTESLSPGQALVWVHGDPLTGSSLEIMEGVRYDVAGTAELPVFLDDLTTMSKAILAVLPGSGDLERLLPPLNRVDGKSYFVQYKYHCDVAGDPERLPAFYAGMGNALRGAVPRPGFIDTIDAARNDFYQVYGSLLFVGIFFVTLFLIATVLIIYYKQITEGFDDRERFQIMEKVGMSKEEVRSAIKKQVLLVFFLPLGMAILHVAAAFRALCQILLIFQMTNTGFFASCVLVTAVLFSLLYFAVYRLTARTYFRIVQSKA